MAGDPEVSEEDVRRLVDLAKAMYGPSVKVHWTPAGDDDPEAETEWAVYETPDGKADGDDPLVSVSPMKWETASKVAAYVAAARPQVVLAMAARMVAAEQALAATAGRRWEVREVQCPSDEELERMEFAPLDPEDKEILRRSGVPDLEQMASDDPVVAKAATIRRVKSYLSPERR